MSTVIRFLETMGGNALVARASTEEYLSIISTLGGDTDCRDALAEKDAIRLGDLLNGRHKMMCIVFAPDDDQKTDNPEQEDEEPGEGDVRSE